MILLLFILSSISACGSLGKQASGADATPVVKNVIVMIGDGMGAQQIGLLESYARLAPHSVYINRGRQTGFSKFSKAGKLGLSMTHPADSMVADSACSATQLASGAASRNGLIGIDANGNRVETVLELAKAHGKSTGLVSDTRITHATPAAFAAHQASRKRENEIAVDMLTSGNVDVMLSGGLRHWIPATVNQNAAVKQAIKARINTPGLRLKSKRKDQRNLLHEAESLGYTLAFNRSQLNAAKLKHGKLLGLFAYSGMLDGISHSQAQNVPNRQQPSLAEMTVKALDVLAQNPKGFFLMVEGGQIDWAGHNNDAGSLLHEMIKFDAAIEAVFQWVKNRTDTLVIITGDHETGGFAFSYSRKDIPAPFPLDGELFKGEKYQPAFNYGRVDILDGLYQQTANFPAMWDAARGDHRIADAAAIMSSVNRHSVFKIDLEQAQSIVQREPNDFRHAHRSYLNDATFPKIHDFKAFYVYGDEVHYDLIGRALAADQNIVWGTGTHTATPVPYLLWGGVDTISTFPSLTSHTELGNLLKQIYPTDIPQLKN